MVVPVPVVRDDGAYMLLSDVSCSLASFGGRRRTSLDALCDYKPGSPSSLGCVLSFYYFCIILLLQKRQIIPLLGDGYALRIKHDQSFGLFWEVSSLRPSVQRIKRSSSSEAPIVILHGNDWVHYFLRSYAV